MGEAILQVRELETHFVTTEGVVRACDRVSFDVNRGEILGLVGESGSGKTVTGLSIIRLVPEPPGRICGGEIWFKGADLLRLDKKVMYRYRGDRISMVFQNPMTCLYPYSRVGQQLVETIRLHRPVSRGEAHEQALAMLRRVGVPNPLEVFAAYQHSLSGGMRQRVMVAMALLCQPDLLIADEPTTQLAATIQAQILGLLRKLRDELGIAILMITHDFGVVAKMCDRVCVMYAGKVVESAPTDVILNAPKHPYTIGLINSVPRMNNKGKRLFQIEGQPPDMLDLPSGCRFAPRCPEAVEICWQGVPPEIEIGSTHAVRCVMRRGAKIRD
ncbi:MAG: peptide ABC transporter ATP-binding protein [Candidatus Rokuibacteriota bacterium]|nr:MAG: peptide ABC transporter ATP-binding protein [Candidatus Rokubacteria bacterium]